MAKRPADTNMANSKKKRFSLWFCNYSKIQTNSQSRQLPISSSLDKGYSACTLLSPQVMEALQTQYGFSHLSNGHVIQIGSILIFVLQAVELNNVDLPKVTQGIYSGELGLEVGTFQNTHHMPNGQ